MMTSTPGDSDRFPVFVVGCPRSGTTLLYHMLVSAGVFANYRAETHLYDMMLPHFGPFERKDNLERFVERWLRSYYFEKTGLEEDALRARILSECRSGGDFLRIVLGSIADAQGRPRWAECTPAHLLHMKRIKAEIPEARFLHIVRDGRDVAVSINRLGWTHPLPWDRSIPVQASGWLWQWMVDKGRHIGMELGASDYREVRFEDLIREPQTTLDELAPFVGCELDYAFILANAVGSVSKPNTAFPKEEEGGFDPVGRFRKKIDQGQLAQMETIIGDTLRRHGYQLATTIQSPGLMSFRSRMFHLFRDTKEFAKRYTRLGRILTRVDMP